jgi:hypothetical protein
MAMSPTAASKLTVIDKYCIHENESWVFWKVTIDCQTFNFERSWYVFIGILDFFLSSQNKPIEGTHAKIVKAGVTE